MSQNQKEANDNYLINSHNLGLLKSLPRGSGEGVGDNLTENSTAIHA